MNSHSGIKNRRSDSQILPRLFLLLQVVILTLLSYITFITLGALGVSIGVITAVLFIANSYKFSKIFLKCKSISKRNHFTRILQMD